MYFVIIFWVLATLVFFNSLKTPCIFCVRIIAHVAAHPLPILLHKSYLFLDPSSSVTCTGKPPLDYHLLQPFLYFTAVIPFVIIYLIVSLFDHEPNKSRCQLVGCTSNACWINVCWQMCNIWIWRHEDWLVTKERREKVSSHPGTKVSLKSSDRNVSGITYIRASNVKRLFLETLCSNDIIINTQIITWYFIV